MSTTASPAKFSDPAFTAKGEQRASVSFTALKTLWFNTGSLCNITCRACYIESSPANDRLVYLKPDDVSPFLDELDGPGAARIEIGFTGGEPFLNPDMVTLAAMALSRGHKVLILTNAMRPMLRPRVAEGLRGLIDRYGAAMTVRVSLDHYTPALHDAERGEGGFEETCAGIDWLARAQARIAIAGRTLWGESEEETRAGFAALIAARSWPVDANDPASLVLFPEMDVAADPPEITPSCWSILGKDPADLMCASQRMVVRRKGAQGPVVLPCTLLPYDPQFELAGTLAQAKGPVALNHPNCATFCVLGGGSCSA